ncbi:hypothetical protein [Caulobacter sp. BK020]|uniref:CC_3452 family protein n=1 Tax=Caulobacter sp. BK020 TaxID=2512117 RepID=UPI001046A95B|nr:hypothetical protein [Caulobacter sp. BK020]TCS10234.1 hypothetical protein EV278_11991 [Caulobacter sp. BK020]
MRSFIIAVAALAATGGPAMAETKAQNGWLTLSAPAAQEHVVFDGAVWRCKGDTCRSTQVKSLPPLRSCKRLARELGPITGFGYRGVTLSDAQLAQCNPVQIAKAPPASELAAAR